MASYRLYCFAGRGKVGQIEIFDAETDEAAVHQAYSKHLDVSCEVWEGDRLVAHIRVQDEHEDPVGDGKSSADVHNGSASRH